MQITVKLFAMLETYLPDGTEKHATAVELTNGATPNEVIERFGIPRSMIHLVLLNGVYIPPSEFDQTVLKEGDALALWPPIAGG